MSLTPNWSRNYQYLTLHKLQDSSDQQTVKHLSPDRWSPSGWKYVAALDPPSPYLSHPNKRNAYPIRTNCNSIAYPDSLRLQTSSQLHYKRIDTEVKEQVSGREHSFSPLPASREKVGKTVRRLPRSMRKHLQEFDGYHEPNTLVRLRTASPVAFHRYQYASPEPKHFNKRKTLLTEWMEQTILSRKR